MEKKDLEKSIVVVATELFLSLGFKSVTMDDIAVEMGISKKTIYNFFENKEQLVKKAVFNLYDAITSGIESIRINLRIQLQSCLRSKCS
jgi:AcrR family transcriptional regulator